MTSPISIPQANGQPPLFMDGGLVFEEGGRLIGKAIDEHSHSEAFKLSDFAARRLSGKPVTMGDIGIADVNLPATAATFSIPTLEAVADIAAPVVLIPREEFAWFGQSAQDETKQATPAMSSPGAEPPMISLNLTSTKSFAPTYALGSRFPTAMLHGQADFDVVKVATARLCEQLRLARELRVIALLTTSANWAAANVISIASGSQWNGGGSAKPLQDCFSALAASTVPANTLVLSEQAVIYLFAGSSPSTYQYAISAGLELPFKVVVAKMKQTVGGLTKYAWSPSLPASALMLRYPDGPEDLSSARTFRLREVPGNDGVTASGVLVRVFRDVLNGGCNTYVVTCHADQESITDNTIGALLSGVLQ